MAITLTVAQFIADARIGETAEELALATRRVAYATEAVMQHLGGVFDDTPDTVVDEAVSRLAAYLYDAPTTAGGAAFANSMRNSGAGRILLPYRIHRAGSTVTAVAAAQAAVGTVGNPVTDISIERGLLVVTFADGSTEELGLPSAREVGQTDIFDARLPGAAVAMRFGWDFANGVNNEQIYIRDNNHPDDGAAEGTTAGLLTPLIPPSLLADPKPYRFYVWIAGSVGLVGLHGPYGDNWLPEFPAFEELTVDGVDGLSYAERHSRSNEDGLYSFVGVIPGELIATEPWVETQLMGIVPGGTFGGVDQTARDAAEAAQDTADDGVTDAAAAKLIADANAIAIAGIGDIPPHVYVQTNTPSEGKLGDVWIQDLTTYHPRIYEHNGTQYQLDYSFLGGRVHFTSEAQNVAMNTPLANVGDMLFSLDSGTLKLYQRLLASSPPYWADLGTVAGGGGEDVAAGTAAPVLIGSGTAVGTPIFIGLPVAAAASFYVAYNAGTYPGGYRIDLVWTLGTIVHGASALMPHNLFPTLVDGSNYYFHYDASAALDPTISRYVSLNRSTNPDKVEILTLPTGHDFDAGTTFTLWGLP